MDFESNRIYHIIVSKKTNKPISLKYIFTVFIHTFLIIHLVWLYFVLFHFGTITITALIYRVMATEAMN